MEPEASQIPVRTILAAIGLVVATGLLLLAIRELAHVLTLTAIAGVFAVAVLPAVDHLDRRLTWCPRSMVTLGVFLVLAAVTVAVVAAVVAPLAREGRDLVRDLPRLVADVRAGHGPVGHLLNNADADEWLQRNEGRLQTAVASLGAPAFGLLRTVADGLLAGITIFTLSFLMVLRGPRHVESVLVRVRPEYAARARAVGRECSRTIIGYVTGNLVISVVCGSLTYVVLRLLDVPFPGLLALFVAIADLVPMVGATVGAAACVLVGFTQSTSAGVALIAFFVVYQQLENKLLQPMIYARTVSLDPLAILVSLLVCSALAGVIGALLAVPIAGIVRAIGRDLWDHRPARAGTAPAEDPAR